MPRPTRAVVDLDAIAGNFHTLAGLAGGTSRVFPVLKANAYGHGAVPVARRLVREGAVRFAVALFEEGVELRAAGIEGEILLLSSGARGDAAVFASHGLIPTLYDVEQARTLAASAAGLGAPLPVHLEVDTGMGRLGVRQGDLSRMIGLLRRSPELRLAGTFTHFARADEPRSDSTARQVEAFSEALSRIRSAGLDPGLVHAANSAAALAAPGALFDATRPGIALFGIAPSERVGHPALRPALTLETEILAVQRVPAGTALGYGGTFMTSRPTDVATLPIGYHDGLRRSFSGRLPVLIRGGRAPIVGAVSMDLTLVDATDCGGAPGDRVVVLGRLGSEELGAWDLARAAGTIAYEIVCGIGSRVPREYVP